VDSIGGRFSSPRQSRSCSAGCGTAPYSETHGSLPSKKSEKDIKPSPAPFIISFFTALLTAIVLAALIRGLGVDTLGGGLLLGAITGVGFIATAMASDSAFCGWGMPLLLIQAGYRVLYSIVIGGILGAWT